MARISIKYPCGTTVTHFTGVEGKVTAVTNRGKYNVYEMSYLKDDNPVSVVVEEFELEISEKTKVGF